MLGTCICPTKYPSSKVAVITVSFLTFCSLLISVITGHHFITPNCKTKALNRRCFTWIPARLFVSVEEFTSASEDVYAQGTRTYDLGRWR